MSRLREIIGGHFRRPGNATITAEASPSATAAVIDRTAIRALEAQQEEKKVLEVVERERIPELLQEVVDELKADGVEDVQFDHARYSRLPGFRRYSVNWGKEEAHMWSSEYGVVVEAAHHGGVWVAFSDTFGHCAVDQAFEHFEQYKWPFEKPPKEMTLREKIQTALILATPYGSAGTYHWDLVEAEEARLNAIAGDFEGSDRDRKLYIAKRTMAQIHGEELMRELADGLERKGDNTVTYTSETFNDWRTQCKVAVAFDGTQVEKLDRWDGNTRLCRKVELLTAERGDPYLWFSTSWGNTVCLEGTGQFHTYLRKHGLKSPRQVPLADRLKMVLEFAELGRDSRRVLVRNQITPGFPSSDLAA